MAVNKVEVNGETKLDLTQDTVTPENLLSGATAHNAAGEQISGAVAVAEASTTTPKAPGTAAVGAETKYARGDHVHPKEVSDDDRAAWDGKAAGTHASQHGASGSDPITPSAIRAVGYDVPQSLSNAQKEQARGNIFALNGQHLWASSTGGKIGWYRITEPFARYNTSGYLTVSHAWESGGPSELLLGISMNPDKHGQLQCLRGVGQSNSVPYISNARLVEIDNMYALDLYVSGAAKNKWDLQLCNCGRNPITLTTPTFISADDTLPSGESLAAVMEYQNPPMLLWVEYKTTERYLGYPVYVKLINLGVMPSAGGTKTISVSDLGIRVPISMDLTWGNTASENFVINNYAPYLASAGFDNANINIVGGPNADPEHYTIYALLRYTKNTN